MVQESLCPVCKIEEESVCHVLWSCPAASDVWTEDYSPVQIWCICEKDFFKLWEEMTSKLCSNDLELVAVICRKIWLKRNDYILKNQFIHPKKVMRQLWLTRKVFQKHRLSFSMGCSLRHM